MVSFGGKNSKATRPLKKCNRKELASKDYARQKIFPFQWFNLTWLAAAQFEPLSERQLKKAADKMIAIFCHPKTFYRMNETSLHTISKQHINSLNILKEQL